MRDKDKLQFSVHHTGNIYQVETLENLLYLGIIIFDKLFQPKIWQIQTSQSD
jgi:hypothetical protein